jgi:hypothetical protein
VKRATEESATEEATAKAAAVEAKRSSRGHTGPQPGAANGRGQEVCGSEWLHPAGQMSLQGCLETSVCPALSHFFLLFFFFYSVTTSLPRFSSSGAAVVMGVAAANAVVRAVPVSEPRTPEGVPKDVVESKGEPEVAPEVVQEEAPAEGAMIAVHTVAAPPPSRGARAPLSSPTAASGAAASERMEVVLGHPPPFTRRLTSP